MHNSIELIRLSSRKQQKFGIAFSYHRKGNDKGSTHPYLCRTFPEEVQGKKLRDDKSDEVRNDVEYEQNT